MKQLEKMSLANVKGKLSRKEMSNIMAGSGTSYGCNTSRSCSVYANGLTYSGGRCVATSGGNYVTCYCSTDYGYYVPASNGGMSYCWN